MPLATGTQGSPIRSYATLLMTELFQVVGDFRSRGNPHFFINQDEIEQFVLDSPSIYPWTFTGLPAYRPEKLIVNRRRIFLIYFGEEETQALYRRPPRRTRMVLYLPLCIIYGTVPLMSEARVEDFLDFWHGPFVPVMDASLHYLSESAHALPTSLPLLYIHRDHITAYFPRNDESA